MKPTKLLAWVVLLVCRAVLFAFTVTALWSLTNVFIKCWPASAFVIGVPSVVFAAVIGLLWAIEKVKE